MRGWLQGGAVASGVWVLALSTFALAQPTPPPAEAPTTAEAQRRLEGAEAFRLIDAWLEAHRAYYRVPALSAGVVSGGRLVWTGNYGFVDEARRVPVSSSTLYGIGSVTKLFTAVAVMQQAEDGRLKLDEPLTAYLPWATPAPFPGDSAPITLRSILSHASGLPREAGTAVWTAPDFQTPTRAELRAAVPRSRPLHPVNTRLHYSNLGLALAGEAVEAVSGRPYPEYVRERITGPLGMADTRIGLPTAQYGRRLPHGYSALTREGTRTRTPTFEPRAYAPAGGLVSSVDDLARFAAWQFRLLRTERPEVLRASSLREMHRPQFSDPAGGPAFGLGFLVQRTGGQTLVSHDGEIPGYRASLRLHPASETAVIVLRNTSDGVGPYADGMLGLLAKRRGFTYAGEPAAVGVDLEAYAGRYDEQPWGGEGVIVPWAGGLAYLSLPTNDPAGDLAFFKPKGGDLFRRVREDGGEAEEIRFVRDASGRVIHFLQNDNRHARLGVARQGRPARASGAAD